MEESVESQENLKVRVSLRLQRPRSACLHEASMHRASAEQIRRHVQAYGTVLGMGRAEHWLAIAASKERLADALELPDALGLAPTAATEVGS